VVTREADGEEVQVGTISAYLLRFWEYADPVVLFDVLAIIWKRRSLDACRPGAAGAKSVYGAEAHQMGWSSDSQDRRQGNESG
jgi:hypothetical protein